MATLRKFRTKQLTKLKEIERELLAKYPDRAQRVRYIADLLASKLATLRRYTLFDYLHTLHLATREFEEFGGLIPSTAEVEELLRGGEE